MEASEPSTSTTSTPSINNSSCQQTVAGSNQSDANPSESVDEFLSTGRTGRRNALPDILEEKSSHLNTSELPNELQKLSFNDSTEPNGSSGESSGTASCSKQNN